MMLSNQTRALGDPVAQNLLSVVVWSSVASEKHLLLSLVSRNHLLSVVVVDGRPRDCTDRYIQLWHGHVGSSFRCFDLVSLNHQCSNLIEIFVVFRRSQERRTRNNRITTTATSQRMSSNVFLRDLSKCAAGMVISMPLIALLQGAVLLLGTWTQSVERHINMHHCW
jgi:hypothetical protein